MNLEGQGRRILIADADRTVLELLQIRLDLAGYHPFVERNGRAALETIRRIRPAGAILDMDLPDMTGLEILKALKQRSEGSGFPILMIGQKLSVESIQRARTLGAQDCMAKPFSGADVLERTSRMFRRAASNIGRYVLV